MNTGPGVTRVSGDVTLHAAASVVGLPQGWGTLIPEEHAFCEAACISIYIYIYIYIYIITHTHRSQIAHLHLQEVC